MTPTANTPEPGSDETASLRRLKWITVLAPVIFLMAVEIGRRFVYPGLFEAWPGYLLLAGIVVIGALFFSESVFSVIGAMQERLARQNLELIALHESALAITSELELETVLQRIVNEARELVGARYGALSLLGEGDGLSSFLTSGITREERELIGPEPAGHGLLGHALETGQSLRLDDLTQHPSSVGFPPHHPPMKTLIAVPILSQGRVLGSLYLTEKLDGSTFSDTDQAVLSRFAAQSAVAIENARLHQQVRALAITEERERIAREMHDSLAQVLAYVNTKAQAAQQFLRSDKPDRAADQIGQLAAAARDSYADVREGILGLRTSLGEGRELVDSLTDYAETWQDQSGITAHVQIDLDGYERLPLSPLAELQLLRIMQEALANVRKHSGAKAATIRLERQGDEIVASVSDNGHGFDPKAAARSTFPRFGLSTMRERAEAVGGSIEIASRAGEGTSVTIRLPLRESDADT